MTDQELERRLQQAMEHAAPDKLNEILSACAQQKGTGITMTTTKKHRNHISRIAAAAAAFLVLAGGSALGYGLHVNAADARILLDVNPSISITVNSREKVLHVDPLNDDAQKILGSMDLKGTQLETAVNALVGSMLQNGYLDDYQNSILVSVEKDDAAKAESLRQKVAAALNTPLTENGVNPAVLCQNLSEKDKELQKFAADLKISTGKAALIQEITRLDPAIDAKSLAAMTVNDLSLILASRRSGDVAVSQTGTASSKSYISERDAANAAFRHAGIAPGSASYCEVEFDSENGVMVYEVEFLSGGIEYEYEIDASTGAVLYSMQEPEDDDADDAYDDADDADDDADDAYDDADDAYDDADDAHDDADDADDDANDADDDADDAYDDADDAYDDADDAHDDADDADDDANDADDDEDDIANAVKTAVKI